MRRSILALAFAAAALAACGSTRVPIDADLPDDAQAIDADETPPIDAAVDMAPPPIDGPQPLPGQEFTGGAGRVGGPTFTMDVQLGHPVGQQSIQSGTYRLEANTPVKP